MGLLSKLVKTGLAVGAGITSVLFFVTLKRIHAIDEDRKDQDEQKS